MLGCVGIVLSWVVLGSVELGCVGLCWDCVELGCVGL